MERPDIERMLEQSEWDEDRLLCAYALELEWQIEHLCKRLTRKDKRIAALQESINEAIKHAGNRWSEWGERAEGCLNILEAAREAVKAEEGGRG